MSGLSFFYTLLNIINFTSNTMKSLIPWSILLLILFTSCDESQRKLQKELEKSLQDGIESIQSNSTMPIEEVKKLSQLEYKSITFPIDISPSNIEETLSGLGKEGWDCNSIFPRPRSAPEKPEIVVVCKRTPYTVMKYVPRSLIGR